MPIPGHIRVLGVFAIGFQIYNIVGTGQSWPYLFGIMTVLVNGSTVFLILVLSPVNEGNPPNKSVESDT